MFFVVAQTPVPALTQGLNKDDNTTQNVNGKGKTDENPATTPPAIVNPKRTTNTNNDDESKATPNTQRSITISGPPRISSERGWADWVLWWCSILLVPATLIIAIYAVVQASAAKISANAQMDANRTWLLVTVGNLPDITPVPDMLQVLWIEPRVANEGKTPAWITKMRLRAQQFPSLKDIPTEPIYEGGETKHFDGEAALPPGASVAPLRVGVDAHDFIAIRQGKSFLYVYGFIDYMDIYKRPFGTRFCFLYHVPGGFNPIPEGFVFGGPSAYNKVT